METNFVICLLAFDCQYKINDKIRIENNEFYTNSALQRIDEIKKEKINNIILFTNKSEKFENKNINIIDYVRKKYSFADKLTACHYGLTKYNTILYLDSDCSIDFSLFNPNNFDDGITISQYWMDGALKEFDEINNDGYFDKIVKYCQENNLKYNNAPLIEERLMIIKNSENIDLFFKIYFDLKKIIEENDESFGNHPIGRGEGLAMGIAILNSKIKFNGVTDEIKKLKLTHIPYEEFKSNIC